MNYISTRGKAPELGFEDVLLVGLARDGGLYVPETWPRLDDDKIRSFRYQSYQETAFDVMWPYLHGAMPADEFRQLIDEAYASFAHRAVTPLYQIGRTAWVLELFHGPTLAFKDVAMQILGRLMDVVLQKRGQRATIVVATSGDTGGSAIEAFRGREAIDIFVLHPEGRVTEVQRRQMTTPSEANVHNIALQGTFDDCQALVKAMFNDLALRDRLKLTAVNSINWARIMAQIVYYFTSGAQLGAPERPMRYVVPTGNFGDIFAGYVAKQMGLPIEQLVIATNINDILVKTLSSGNYTPHRARPTCTPSMDIQVSSNFERLIFEATGRRAERVNELMAELQDKGSYQLTSDELARLTGGFAAFSVDEAATSATIAQHYRGTSDRYMADPHTAVGLRAAELALEQDEARGRHSKAAMISLATAHPAKFPDTIVKAIGRAPGVPQSITDQASLPERYAVLPNDYAAVTEHIRARARAASEQAL